MVHKHHIFQVSLSSIRLLLVTTRKATRPPMATGNRYPIRVSFQKVGHRKDQKVTGIAIVHLATQSPRITGMVPLSRARSPSWSGRSCICKVVRTTNPMIASHLYAVKVKECCGWSEAIIVAPRLYETNPKRFKRFRTKKCWSAPPKSLYIQVNTISATETSIAPRYRVRKKTVGMMINSRWRACFKLILFDGIGRHGLLTESSFTEPGRLWLETVKSRRFSHSQVATRGRRLMMAKKSGDELVVMRGPDRALKMPKIVSGPTIDLISLQVKSQRVCRWYTRPVKPRFCTHDQ